MYTVKLNSFGMLSTPYTYSTGNICPIYKTCLHNNMLTPAYPSFTTHMKGNIQLFIVLQEDMNTYGIDWNGPLAVSRNDDDYEVTELYIQSPLPYCMTCRKLFILLTKVLTMALTCTCQLCNLLVHVVECCL